MPLVAAGQTKGWVCYLKLTDGNFLRASATDRLRFAGVSATDAIDPSNSSTHLFASDDSTHLCSTTHGRNTRRLTNTTVSIDGAASSSLPISQANCSFLFTLFSLAEIVTSSARLYAYDGVTDATPMPAINVYLAEGGVSSSWVSGNGSGAGLNLANHSTPAVDHDFYVACSVEATGGGIPSTGAFKITLSYV